MALIIRNRSLLTVFKKNFDQKIIRNYSILCTSNDIHKIQQNYWINKRNHTTLETAEKCEEINLGISSVDNHYDVIIIGGGMVSSIN